MLSANWSEICTPVMITGPITVYGLSAEDTVKASRGAIITEWSEDEKIYKTADQKSVW